MVTVVRLLKLGTEKLKNSKIDTPQLDAEVILCNLLNIERIQLHIYPNREISQEICRSFMEAVEKRIKQMPIQYIVNRQEFMGLDFYVDKRVLIPRGDTEILVEEVIRLYEGEFPGQRVRLLDIGTGSGAITVSLAKHIPQSQVASVDISEGALAVAAKNAARHGVQDRVRFYHGSLLEPLRQEQERSFLHFIVSNPPYIPRRTIEELSAQVRDYEPSNALDGGEDGLDFYRSIVKEAVDFILPGGWLVFEIGYDQGLAVKELMETHGFREVLVLKDLAGLDRVVRGTWPQQQG